MPFYRKKVLGNQTYVYKILNDENGARKEVYIGNIKSLPANVSEEVENYFRASEYAKSPINVDAIIYANDNDVLMESKKFGPGWIVYQIEKFLGCIKIIDTKIKRVKIKTSTTGMYFFVAALNRTIEPLSKNQIPEWLKRIDLEYIMGIKIISSEFNSDNFWHHWKGITEQQIEDICNCILQRAFHMLKEKTRVLIGAFDATNFFTFFALINKSELAAHGYNKQKRNDLRQICLSCLIAHDIRISIHYKIYKGNINDKKLFKLILNDLIVQSKLCGKDEITLVFDKGMPSTETIEIIDSMENVHFVTSYSVKELPKDYSYLLDIDVDEFIYINCKHNIKLDEKIKYSSTDDIDNLSDLKVKVFICTKKIWGKDRVLIMTYSEELYKKQKHTLDENLSKMSLWLNNAKCSVENKFNGYETEEKFMNLYGKMAEKLEIIFDNKSLSFTYKRNYTFIRDRIKQLGKNIIVSDRFDLGAEVLVDIYYEQYIVERVFRRFKNDDCTNVQPIYHWTDSNIACHIFSCILSMTYMQLIEYVLRKNEINKTAEYILNKLDAVETLIMRYDRLTHDNTVRHKILNMDEECKKIFELFSDDSLKQYFSIES